MQLSNPKNTLQYVSLERFFLHYIYVFRHISNFIFLFQPVNGQQEDEMELEESGESDTDEGIISDIGTICDKDTTDEETEDQDE